MPLTSASRPAVPAGGRARPLPPEERRAALVAATLPLLRQHGRAVTTRQIAEASGVAEGTIFRVFPDKDALIQAVIAAVLDPAPMLEELAAVDPSLALRPRLEQVVAILQRRVLDVFTLLTALGMQGPPGSEAGRRHHNDLLNTEITRLLRSDRKQFRLPLPEVVRSLRVMIFAGSIPTIADGDPLRPAAIVSLVLDGVIRHDEEKR